MQIPLFPPYQVHLATRVLCVGVPNHSPLHAAGGSLFPPVCGSEYGSDSPGPAPNETSVSTLALDEGATCCGGEGSMCSVASALVPTHAAAQTGADAAPQLLDLSVSLKLYYVVSS